jgi:hypothetical protein
MLLGITATPNRTDLQDIRAIFGEEVITISLEEAIARGWLPKIEYHIMTDEGFDEEVLAQITQEVFQEHRRMSMDELNSRVFVRARDEKIAHKIMEFDEKTLIFCRNINHADHFCPFLSSAETLHSRTGRSSMETWAKNREILESLRHGELNRVLAVNALNEGVDVPAVGLEVFLRTTDSENVFFQQLGRGCRPGKDKLVVLDYVGNAQRVMMLRKMRDTIDDFERQSGGSHNGKEPPLEESPLHLSGKGFDFIFSDKLIDLMKVIEQIRAEWYSTWEESRESALKLGLTSYSQYIRKKGYLRDPRLPSNPQVVYPDFPGWAIFLAREAYPTWQEASIASSRLGITSFASYGRLYKRDRRLRSNPHEVYPDFPGYATFFGKLKKKPYVICKEASRAAQRLKIKTKDDYKEKYKQDPRLPGNPREKYPDFPGWVKFLGKKNQFG